MARISKHSISNPIPNHQKPFKSSDFINSSSVKKKIPQKSYHNFYNSVWKSPLNEHGIFRKYRHFWWWQPDRDSIPAHFLESSSMHGLKYVAQPKRHMIERIFWLVSFLACVSGAVVMIMEIWNRYYVSPVIVTFNPAEVGSNSIPFPAITICNINPFKKSTVKSYEKQYREGKTEQERKNAIDALRIIDAICLTQQSFLQTLGFAATRGQMIPEAKPNPSPEAANNITKFLLYNSQPCKELLRSCIWAQKRYECEKLFKPVITDYGKCCTFNMLPQELMEYYHSDSFGNDSVTARKFAWSRKEIEEWNKWDYAANGYILDDDLVYPFRQRRAGVPEGLSVLIDADIEENFCPCTDSEGIKVLYHLPLEAPRVADLGSVIGVGREFFLEVSPDLTIADSGIQSFSHEIRKCYFGRNYKLKFFRPYTRSNCMEECWTNLLIENCGCVPYYAPRNSTTKICSSTLGSNQFQCVKENERKYMGRLNRVCSHCKYSCNDLTYNAEVTYGRLQAGSILWTLANGTKYDWMNHQLTVLHVYIGEDNAVPKFRSKLYQAVDLIANTGGLLGLCIGFSVQSAVEIVYFATMRICCKHLRKSKRFGLETANQTREHKHPELHKSNTIAPSRTPHRQY